MAWAPYCTVANAITLLGTLPQTTAVTDWLALTATEQEQSLVAATYVLDTLDWKGLKCDCDQPQEWPRVVYESCCQIASCNSVPSEVELACAVMGVDIGTTGGSFVQINNGSQVGGGGGSESANGLDQFSDVTIGPINVKMREDVARPNTLINSLSPFLAGILDKYLRGLGNLGQGMVRRRSVANAYGLGTLYPAPAWSGRYRLAGGVVRPRYGYW